jgi:hypothetical protein
MALKLSSSFGNTIEKNLHKNKKVSQFIKTPNMKVHDGVHTFRHYSATQKRLITKNSDFSHGL